LILSANSSDGKSLSIMAGLLWSGYFGEQLLSAEAGSAECNLPLSEGLAGGSGRSTHAESR